MARKTEYRSDTWRKRFAPLLPLPCSKCGYAVLPEHAWDVDHLVPRAYGGMSTWDNLRPAHRKCNRGAGQAIGQRTIRARKSADAGDGLGLL